jgi:hypothetical protein
MSVCPLTIIVFFKSLVLLLPYVMLLILQWFLCVCVCVRVRARVCARACVRAPLKLYNHLTSFHEIRNEPDTTEGLSNVGGRAKL